MQRSSYLRGFVNLYKRRKVLPFQAICYRRLLLPFRVYQQEYLYRKGKQSHAQLQGTSEAVYKWFYAY